MDRVSELEKQLLAVVKTLHDYFFALNWSTKTPEESINTVQSKLSQILESLQNGKD